jgi:signal transduction histidine kinase
MRQLFGPIVFVLSGWLIALGVLNPSASAVTGAVAVTALFDGNNVPITLPLRERDQSQRLFRASIQSDVDFVSSQAIFIGFARQPMQMRANGVPLERISLRPGADESGFRQAFLFLVPTELLHTGGNTLEFSLKPASNMGNAAPYDIGLSDIWFGPRDALEAHFRAIYASRVTLAQITVIAAMLIAVFGALIWWARPSETLYGWFSLGVGLWMIYLLHFVWYRAPLNGHCWLAFIHVALAGSLLCVQQFCREFLRQPRTRSDCVFTYATVVISIFMVLISIFLPDTLAYEITLNWVLRGLLLGLGLHIVATLLYASAVRRDAQIYWLCAAAILGLSLGIYDSAVILELLPNASTLLFHLGVLPLVVVFGYILLQRFVLLIEAAEAQNLVLDQRVQQKSMALEHEFNVRQALERERMLVDERHRLATDLHDGAGSQLVSLLAAVRREGMSQQQMEQALLEAIADLRLVMDSIDSMGNDLAEALGQFRSRSEPRLRAAGLSSVWRTATLREGLKLSPRRTLNIFRALQEALVNVVKHANASEVQISARDAGSVLEISVRDNGRGLPAQLIEAAARVHTLTPSPTGKVSGRGLANLASRMKSLGGYAKFQPASTDANAPGLDVSLYIPIPAENETKW